MVVRFLWAEPIYGYPKGLIVPDQTKVHVYKANFTGFFPGLLYNKIPIIINSKGLRDVEHNYSNPQNAFRILGLGDSLTLGSGIALEDTYLFNLEKNLQKKRFNVEIIKAGINSYDLDQEYAFYREEGYAYNPNLIIIGITLNDIVPVDVQKRMKASFGKKDSIASIKKFIQDNCKLCSFIYLSLKPILAWGEKNYNLVYFETVYPRWNSSDWSHFSATILELNKHLESRDQKLFLLYFPYTFQFNHSIAYGNLPQEKLFKLSTEKNITFIDMTSRLDTEDFKKYYLTGDEVHLNPEGNRVASDVILEEMLNNNFFDTT